MHYHLQLQSIVVKELHRRYMDDYLLQLQSIVVIFALIILCKVLWHSTFKSFNNKHKQPPQPFFALPVIGHLHLLLNAQPFHHKLGEMADKLGPAFMLRLGSRRTLVISSWEVAKECFTVNDKALASRPSNTAAVTHLAYKAAFFGLAPYGSFWRSMRKIATTELLSNTRLDKLKHVMLAEVDTCIKELHNLCGDNNNDNSRVDMKEWLGDLNFNIILQMVTGKRFFGSGGGSDEAWRFRKATHKFFHLLFVSVPSDMFPWLEWMDLGGYVKAMKAVAKEMDSVMVRLVEEHRERRASGVTAGGTDFIDVMLSIMEDDHELQAYFDKETLIIATSLNLILGGTDTTTISLIRVLAHLLNNPDALKKAQTELEEQVGVNRVVNESDINNLIYLQAMIKESLRLTPSSELLVPRETVEDCTISGFHIPAGTQVIVNAWKLQRDPSVWPDPLEFRPNRFLPSHAAAGIDVKGQNYELIPFGSGRRLCPGISMSLHVMHLTLARLIQAFELRLINNVPNELFEGLFSMALHSAPLVVEITPRLPLELYQS
ncbi:cytochrome P450 CYP82D47-like [Dioscorea cayenensis subsp. rotundata]|uniref:Cytochrome P450 CYP82D47-like n=1 Tax=Dioscorea cayennensis subsp. rotundata TaxID=55577 RepID=A0AB40CNG5_DIOCR|nr:cytochrome P450 CYP82D47-like [Dioscorea cayenensis subsp. rotundata]